MPQIDADWDTLSAFSAALLQRLALAEQNGIAWSRAHVVLLHGVNGSGKTLAHLGLPRRVLVQGKSAIVLVPEIALTPQTVDRFRAVFGDQIAVLHAWRRARRRGCTSCTWRDPLRASRSSVTRPARWSA